MTARTTSTERKRPMYRKISVVAAAALVALLASGCSQRIRAERDGRDLASAVCDLSKATTVDAAQSAMQDINKQLDDLEKRYGNTTAQDRNDIQRNLDQLSTDAQKKNEVQINQDLAQIQRNAEQARGKVQDVSESAYTGFSAGVQECITG